MKTALFCCAASLLLLASCLTDEGIPEAKPHPRTHADNGKTLVLQQTDVQLLHADSVQLFYEHAAGPVTLKSEDERIAYIKNGWVKGAVSGQTRIFVSDGQTTLTCNVTVNKQIDQFPEPHYLWGASLERIKTLVSTVGSVQVPKNKDPKSTEQILLHARTFEGSPYVYQYEFSSNRLVRIALYIPRSTRFATRVMTFLRERYYFVKEENASTFIYSPLDGKLKITADESSENYFVLIMEPATAETAAH